MAADLFVAIWLPLLIALIGVGGTITVTVVQLRARQRELDEDRRDRDRREVEHKRDELALAVHEAIGQLTAAPFVAAADRTRENAPGFREVNAVGSLILVNVPADADPLTIWWKNRTEQWAVARPDQAMTLEAASRSEITAWHQREASASEVADLSKTIPDLGL